MIYLFSKWKEVKEILKSEFIFLFLDYDGTIAPIAETPDKAPIPKSSKELLSKLSRKEGCKVAVISGRAIGNVRNLVGLDDVVYVGNHGLEIEGPKIKFESVVPPRYKEDLNRLKYKIEKKLSPFKGVLVENKGYTLSVHYRRVDKKQIPSVQTAFHEAVITGLIAGKIKIRPGKMLLEIRPPVEWDKGKAVLWLLARQKFAINGGRILPVYIGDDLTDEDAFRVLKKNGLTVFVGKPKKSNSQYYLKNTREVAELLKRILELRKA